MPVFNELLSRDECDGFHSNVIVFCFADAFEARSWGPQQGRGPGKGEAETIPRATARSKTRGTTIAIMQTITPHATSKC